MDVYNAQNNKDISKAIFLPAPVFLFSGVKLDILYEEFAPPITSEYLLVIIFADATDVISPSTAKDTASYLGNSIINHILPCLFPILKQPFYFFDKFLKSFCFRKIIQQ